MAMLALQVALRCGRAAQTLSDVGAPVGSLQATHGMWNSTSAIKPNAGGLTRVVDIMIWTPDRRLKLGWWWMLWCPKQYMIENMRCTSNGQPQMSWRGGGRSHPGHQVQYLVTCWVADITDRQMSLVLKLRPQPPLHSILTFRNGSILELQSFWAITHSQTLNVTFRSCSLLLMMFHEWPPNRLAVALSSAVQIVRCRSYECNCGFIVPQWTSPAS